MLRFSNFYYFTVIIFLIFYDPIIIFLRQYINNFYHFSYTIYVFSGNLKRFNCNNKEMININFNVHIKIKIPIMILLI